MGKIKKQGPEPILTLKLAVLLGLAVAFCLPVMARATAPFSDDFEDYDLGDLNGQGGWIRYSGEYHQVVNDKSNSPSQSITCYTAGAPCLSYKEGELIPSGSLDFYFYSASSSSSFEIVFAESLATSSHQLAYILATDKIYYHLYPNSPIFLANIELNVWNKVSFEWSKDTQKVRYKFNNENWTSWVEPNYSRGISGDFTGFSLVNPMFGGNGVVWLDDFSPPKRVYVNSPASGGTATSTNFDFIVGWEGWDFEDIYKDFVFSFLEKNTGILTGTKIYEPLTENGTTSLSFADFGIDENGDYYFHAKARSYLYEYTAYYTEDLVSPEWWVNINVAGWEEIFEMPEFETWYGTHSKFATSTAIFTGITTFLAPIFNKIGEFGDKVVEFLNLDEAYDRGYELGKIIPTFRHYISGIEVFFGGFPIIQIFLAFMVILLGIFVVRLILSFKP